MFFPPFLSILDRKIGLPLCFAASWSVHLCVRSVCTYVWSCLGCQRKEHVRWLAGHASEMGQQGDQELKLYFLFPFISFLCLPVFLSTCRNDFISSLLLLASPPQFWLASMSFTVIGCFSFLLSLSFDTSFHLQYHHQWHPLTVWSVIACVFMERQTVESFDRSRLQEDFSGLFPLGS